MAKTIYLFVFLAIYTLRTYASVTGYIEPKDKKLLEILVKTFKYNDDDVVSPYYGAKGFKLLNEPLVFVLQKDTCSHLQSNFKPDSVPEIAFYAISTWNLLGCSGKIHNDVTLKNLASVLENDKSSVSEIRYAAETLQLLGQAVSNQQKIAQLIQAKLKEDDSLQSLGHALHAASLLGNAGKFALDRVEDVVVQADEVDGKMLQWECGLTTTSLLITGLLRLPGAKPFTQAQADKFSTYLLTRRTVQSPRGIVALLEAADALSSSSTPPVSITVIGTSQITIEKPELKVHISDLLGRPLKPAPTPVVAQSATRVVDDVVMLSKQPLSPGAEPTQFILPLKLVPGQYRVGLTAGSHSTALTVRVTGPISLQWLEIGVADADGSSAPRLTKLQHPSKLTSPLQADATQHLIMKFPLTRVVHQSFLRLYSGKNEIIFVAEPDLNLLYKLEVNLAAELSHSGTFDMELILGDSVMNNPIRWSLGTLEVKLGAAQPPQTPVSRGPKPEIKHLFRPAEKRPPQIVSVMFTALAAAPLLLLLILWLKLGINVKNFTFIAIPFHIGLGAIIGLFTLFWLKLNMFTTCGWLIPIGGFTFLAGHKLLSHIANKKI